MSEQTMTWRTVDVEPIEDLLAICEMMADFDVSHPEDYAALKVAKAAAANRQIWTGEPIEPPTAGLLAACEATLARLDYLQELWGKEAITDGLADQVRAAVAKATKGGPA